MAAAVAPRIQAGRVNRVLTRLERWFADREFVATEDFIVADILLAHVLSSGIKDGNRWRAACGSPVVSGSVPGSARVEADRRGAIGAWGAVPTALAPKDQRIVAQVRAVRSRSSREFGSTIATLGGASAAAAH